VGIPDVAAQNLHALPPMKHCVKRVLSKFTSPSCFRENESFQPGSKILTSSLVTVGLCNNCGNDSCKSFTSISSTSQYIAVIRKPIFTSLAYHGGLLAITTLARLQATTTIQNPRSSILPKYGPFTDHRYTGRYSNPPSYF
jgi:hypothetical protein